ncbi:MAG: MarR family winged helix-turn-helix transcriptional regulator [Acholeplasmatales bacterium]|nr:MarR family winged helix-turn-helix transcriptional regulator [Acholeplasmatales bacterium]
MYKEFFYRFGKLIYKIDYYYAEIAKKSGVKPNLMWILYALNDGKSHSQKDISISWDIPITTINTIVKELNNDGYVDLIHIPGKRREMNIILTDKGKEYSKNILKDIYEIEEKVFKSLGEKVRINDDLEFLLKKLYESKGE